MKRILFALLFVLGFIAPAMSQTADDSNEGARLSLGTGNSYAFSWWGRTGRTYFVQHSEDLMNWVYFPDIIDSGTNAPLSYGFSVSGPDRFFLRLKYTDIPTGNPNTADFDGDGVSNLAELQAGLDPLHYADSDNNQLPDDWEVVHAGTFAAYPGKLSAQFQTGGSATRSLILSNATNQPVTYTVAVQNNELPIYSAQDSAHGGPAYTWEEISGTGTLLAAVSDGDDVSQTVTLTQFAFPYYGANYSSVHVSSNGFLTLSAPSTDYGNVPLPMPSAPSLLIAPLWDDLNPGAGGEVYVQELNNRLIIQYHQVAPYNGNGTLTFQVVLYSSGDVEFRYLSLTADATTCTVGIQNAGGTKGLQLAYNEACLSSQFSVHIRPVTRFFTLNQFSGTVPAQSQQTINATFNGVGVEPGVYTAQIQVSHNGIGTSPIVIPAIATITAVDTDGDLIPDWYEIANDLNPLVNDAALDRDEDGLTNLEEYRLGTLANQYDSDGDGLNDGWELRYGFDPLVENTYHSNPNLRPDADPDLDGLTNLEEEQLDTNPFNADTDGDGSSDYVENRNASDPSNAASTPTNPGGIPGGPAGPITPKVRVAVYFGDPSGSHSEKYRVILQPLEGDPNTKIRWRTNQKFGQTQTDVFDLPKGAKYKVTLKHFGTDPAAGLPSPDYDYVVDFDASQGCVVTDDPEGILGEHYESDPFFAQGKEAKLHIPLFEWVTPKGSPVTAPDDAGDGQNEFTYNTVSPGVLTIDLKVLVKPTGTAGLTAADGSKFADRCVFALPSITGSTFAWDAANASGMSNASGEHLLGKATFTTLPANNSDFGAKQAEFACDGQTDTLSKADFEVFYSATATNHLGGDPTHPNWFHYSRQNEGGTDYGYDPLIPTSQSVSGVPGSTKLANSAYTGGVYITTTINTSGRLVATGASPTYKYYKYFYGVVKHERQHAYNETSVGDSDGDDLSSTFEINISHTDPNNKFSAVGGGINFSDDEIYAGGPVEQAGINAADTSQDWANPGTNSKP